MENSYLTKEIYDQNEIDANKGLAKGCFFASLAILLAWIFYLTGVFEASQYTSVLVNISFPILVVWLGTSILYIDSKYIKKRQFKYYLIVQFVLAIAILNVLLPKHGVLMWAACILVVNHYFSPKLTLFAFILVSITMFLAIYMGMFLGEWDANLLNGAYYIELDGVKINVDEATIGQRIRYINFLKSQGDNRYLKVFVYYYLPRFLTLAIISNVGYGVSKRSLRLLMLESKTSKDKEKMQSELNVASEIQQSVLPKDDKSDENIYGMMEAAKEIGGDFYDYFYVDDSHLALVIGDVSGKGIPAALFMMKTETLIKSLTMSFKDDTSYIMTRSNISLCNNNDTNVFVTCWLGILNLVTGELKYTNAGHNKVLAILDGTPKFLEGKPGVVLGAFDGSKYHEEKITLAKGDKLLLYTDGVTEAHNINNELYGENRLLRFAKNNKNHNPESFVVSLKKDIDSFSLDCEQFDDITILAYKFEDVKSIVESRVFEADVKELDNLFDYASSLLKVLEFSKKDIVMINTALEEIFVNVAHYAYSEKEKGTVTITLSKTNDSVTFVFKDSGKPFNPLELSDPDITASSDEREVGGLGIFMVKKIMDEVHYEYQDNQNILTLVKYKK